MITAWLSGLLGPPLAAALLSGTDRNPRRIRTFALGCAIVSCVASALVPFVPELASLCVHWPWQTGWLLGPSLLRMSVLSRLLLSLPPILWLVTVAATPSARLDRAGLGRTAAATWLGSLAFLTQSPLLLAACWSASSLLFVWGVSPGTHPRTTRVLATYHLVAVLLLVLGLGLAMESKDNRQMGLYLMIAAILIRKGILPFHAWIPEAFDQARIGPTVLFSAPQLGTYVAAVLVLPQASADMLRTVAVLSLITAVYGAALALAQADARRALGYLFVSQSALVLAGLDCTSTEALTGALVLWVSSALAFTGLARTVLALEARRGRLRLTTHHGGFDQMPLLAASFLLFGLACSGFPGTLGFVGQEMLIDGAVGSFPALGFLTVAATALTGLAVLRMYFALFCGSSGAGVATPLRAREALIFAGVAAALVGSGVLPGAVVELGRDASRQLLQRRSDTSRARSVTGPQGTPSRWKLPITHPPPNSASEDGAAGSNHSEASCLPRRLHLGGGADLGRSATTEGVHPAHALETTKIVVVGVDLASVFERVGGNLSIGREIAAGAQPSQEIEGDVEMARPRDDAAHVGLLQPASNPDDGIIHRKRRLKDSTVGRDPQEAEEAHRRNTDGTIAIEQRFPPASGGTMERKGVDLRIQKQVDVRDDHRRLPARTFASTASSSSSSTS